jgi:uncharacterized protein YdiU (UPF0061 family)
MLAIRQVLINRGGLEETNSHYEKMQPFWAHLLEERDAKYRKLFAKLDAYRAKTDVDREEWEAETKPFNEFMEKREAERTEWEADFEKMISKRKADREEVVARLEAIHDKTNPNQMKLEPEMEHQEEMDVWLRDVKDGRKERTEERNPGEKNVVVERREISN